MHGHLQKNNVSLASPNFIHNEKENEFLSRFIEDKNDYKYYDCLCICFMMVYILDKTSSWSDLFDIKSEKEMVQYLEKLKDKKIP